MGITTPTNFITEAFGSSAVDITVPIPVADPGGGQASFTLGFPHPNKLPLNAGGIPPFLESQNGILNMISAYTAVLGAGQLFPYNSSYATTIGGYALDALVAMADGSGIWQCTTANNTGNPDTGSGTGWAPLFSYGTTTVTSLTSGTVTLTTPQAAKETIVLQGTLTGGVTIHVPRWAKNWVFINNTTGAFSIEVATGAGTLASLPSADPTNPLAVPMGVRCDGTNCYPLFAPIYEPQFFGYAFADTAPVSDNTNKLATTSFVQSVAKPGSNLTTSGPWHRINPDGSITQGGPISAASGNSPVDVGVTFDIPFPTRCFHVSVTSNRSVASAGEGNLASGFATGYTGSGPISGCTVTIDNSTGNPSVYHGTYQAEGF